MIDQFLLIDAKMTNYFFVTLTLCKVGSTLFLDNAESNLWPIYAQKSIVSLFLLQKKANKEGEKSDT